MPRVTIRNKPSETGDNASGLMKKVRKKTSDILEQSDRVLVVYSAAGAATLYYEGKPAPARNDSE